MVPSAGRETWDLQMRNSYLRMRACRGAFRISNCEGTYGAPIENPGFVRGVSVQEKPHHVLRTNLIRWVRDEFINGRDDTLLVNDWMYGVCNAGNAQAGLARVYFKDTIQIARACASASPGLPEAGWPGHGGWSVAEYFLIGSIDMVTGLEEEQLSEGHDSDPKCDRLNVCFLVGREGSSACCFWEAVRSDAATASLESARCHFAVGLRSPWIFHDNPTNPTKFKQLAITVPTSLAECSIEPQGSTGYSRRRCRWSCTFDIDKARQGPADLEGRSNTAVLAPECDRLAHDGVPPTTGSHSPSA
ncbi:hypothetical protein SODALDRAFT_380149 [Sodiomyces alkalinus F11]|uniref:Uncharacterized protein n=1 Tax=Sodiomyces alkalinus (strain CBS 110278 / VKM F-3762 / F11) TaxID=1314773 RepID=A0A3N2PT60_SODAK|nr:hypothetical protein SODALDRAFT_380149 [Sodiomyces alkalinus F11]ROT37712.1 hypothetical protein SODALDRAFT_380149 [Sodiomyces alkalinus F11]